MTTCANAPSAPLDEKENQTCGQHGETTIPTGVSGRAQTMTRTMTHSNEVSNNLSTLPYGLEWREGEGEEEGFMTLEKKNLCGLLKSAQGQILWNVAMWQACAA